MPAIQSQQRSNGFARDKMHSKNGLGNSTYQFDKEQQIGAALASKKMQLIEDDQANRSNGFHKAPQQDCEVFQDTQTLGPHSASKTQYRPDEEPIVIFDTQNNTSISQTAKDQFAAALLRLQSGLDLSTQRLDAMETKVEDLVRQHKQQQQARGARPVAKQGAGSWTNTLLGEGKLGTLLYLGWPVLVFVAMRAMERRNVLNKLT